jgi:hypothetical protein
LYFNIFRHYEISSNPKKIISEIQAREKIENDKLLEEELEREKKEVCYYYLIKNY